MPDDAPGPPDPEDTTPEDAALPLPPDDRLWRHPSEMALSSRRRAGGGWALAGGAAAVGAATAFGLVALTGGLRTEIVDRTQEGLGVTPTPATLSLAAPLDTAGVATVAEQAAAGLVRVDSSDGGVGGSGVIFTEGGEVLTNAHLVAGLESVELTLADGTAVTGTVLGTDEVTDLAVVSAELPDSVGPALLGSSRDLTTGEAAVLVASPQPGSREPSVTVGVVSGVGRTLVRTDGAHLLDMLQTDASIPPGASGAVLVDRRGAVIGLLTTVGATDPGASGLGYATPIDLARAIAIDIVETGSARHAWLGVDGNDLPTAEAAPLGLVGGAQVRVVTTDSPAQRAGLMDRDIIVRVADAEITSMAGLIVALRDHDPGDDVHIDYIRGGQPRECTASLSDWPEGGA